MVCMGAEGVKLIGHQMGNTVDYQELVLGKLNVLLVHKLDLVYMVVMRAPVVWGQHYVLHNHPSRPLDSFFEHPRHLKAEHPIDWLQMPLKPRHLELIIIILITKSS